MLWLKFDIFTFLGSLRCLHSSPGIQSQSCIVEVKGLKHFVQPASFGLKLHGKMF